MGREVDKAKEEEVVVLYIKRLGEVGNSRKQQLFCSIMLLTGRYSLWWEVANRHLLVILWNLWVT